jgi:hypothetical protein
MRLGHSELRTPVNPTPKTCLESEIHGARDQIKQHQLHPLYWNCWSCVATRRISPTQNANMLISTIRHSLIYQWKTKSCFSDGMYLRDDNIIKQVDMQSPFFVMTHGGDTTFVSRNMEIHVLESTRTSFLATCLLQGVS